MGQLLYYLLPFRRRIIRRNIKHVFGDTHSEADQKRLAQAYYNHIYWTIYENSRLLGMSEGRVKEIVRVEGKEHLVAAKEGGRGALILSGHFGSWEFAPLGAMCHYPEFKGRFWFIRTNSRSKARNSANT